MSENEKARSESTVVLEKSEPKTAPVSDEPAEPSRFKGIRDRLQVIALSAAAVLAAVALVLGVCWHNASGDLNALRTGNSDRDRAAEVATDYAMRSLTYDYKNLPAFFDGVQRGTSTALRDKFTQTHDALTKIMTGAQVVATGQVVGTSVQAQGNDQYAVTVYAIQRTRNLQQPEPAAKPNLLVVTVAKREGVWLVVDYGPKEGMSTDGVAKDGATKDGAAK
ncbi:hypothetical protein OHB26_34055 [Nocardia sp. NBC_01503]|uniref:hypothetical protein n=1 Tax=Nocardia sp. NBC_01503 TaxID=2975997 RepID=UPI002E7B346C|nr:hypothetical protein [Nocardia sp. NBC_01503]WTL31869.1 hypothetical protein OHB26_34055 [Nocardia sp. NBC_01503]